jgi:DNA replication and repair protein RecF
VNALERALRSRNRLLEEINPDPRWLDAVEHEVAELGIAVAAARAETVRRLMREIDSGRDSKSPFPSAALSLDGWMERDLAATAALEVEDRYRANLRDARARDRAAGRTLEGPHLSDLAVSHAEKEIPALRASTGERKALLVGLVLSHARLVAGMRGAPPVVLLDDVAAFLDEDRRAALFDALARLGAQIWMTGVDDMAFSSLGGVGERLRVSPGRVERVA